MPAGKMTEHGWDYWIGFRGTGCSLSILSAVESWRNDEQIDLGGQPPPEVRRPGIVGEKGVYTEDLFLEELLRFIRENKNDPFFIYFPSQVPHGRSPRDGDEIQVPDIGPYADRPWTHLEKLYASMVTRFDGHVGRIIDQLKGWGSMKIRSSSSPAITVMRMQQIMVEAREGSQFTPHWPLPEYRRDDIRLDRNIYRTIGEGEGY